MRDQWEKSGGTDLYQRACEKARNILETYEPPPLPDSVLSEIRSIIDETEKELGV
jgi:trimethylamine:corrinoid methyltransferase-like protein